MVSVLYSTHLVFPQHTVESLLVGEGLPLLGLVPVDNEAVSEGKCSARVGSAVLWLVAANVRLQEKNLQLIAVEQGSRQSGLNMFDCF